MLKVQGILSDILLASVRSFGGTGKCAWGI